MHSAFPTVSNQSPWQWPFGKSTFNTLKEFDPPLKCLECLASLSNYPLTPILSQLKGSKLNCSSCLIELHCNLRRREGLGTMQTIRTHQDHQGILGS